MIKMAASVGQDFSRSKEQLTDGEGDGDEDDDEEILDPRVKVEKGYRTDNNSWSFRIKKLGLLLQWRGVRYIFAFWIAFIIESIFFTIQGELDRLNSSTAEINRLEQDLEVYVLLTLVASIWSVFNILGINNTELMLSPLLEDEYVIF